MLKSLVHSSYFLIIQKWSFTPKSSFNWKMILVSWDHPALCNSWAHGWQVNVMDTKTKMVCFRAWKPFWDIMEEMNIMWLYPEVVSVDLEGSSHKPKVCSDRKLREMLSYSQGHLFSTTQLLFQNQCCLIKMISLSPFHTLMVSNVTDMSWRPFIFPLWKPTKKN